MVLKVSANPNRFFKGVGWQMNIFDLSLVALQWLDVIVTASATDDSSSTIFNVMRIVRMVRLVRIVRSYRVLRMLGEVRAIVWSVGTSFKPLLGAMLVLVGVIYLMAVYLVDTCNAYRVSMESTDAGFQPLGRYFGSVGGGMLTLWQAMTGGIDWATVMSPLLACASQSHHRCFRRKRGETGQGGQRQLLGPVRPRSLQENGTDQRQGYHLGRLPS